MVAHACQVGPAAVQCAEVFGAATSIATHEHHGAVIARGGLAGA